MTAPVAHAAVVELCDPPPPEVAVGASMVLTVRLTCPAGCDLSDAPLTVTAPDGVVHAVPPVESDAAARAIALTVPRTVGAHVWRVYAAPHEAAGIRHEMAPLAVAVRTRSQETSLAVWAMPSSVVTGRRFVVKVGAKSAAGCELVGCKVEIRDQNDLAMASGHLGGTPWPGTSALYWTELELLAPAAAADVVHGRYGSMRRTWRSPIMAHRRASASRSSSRRSTGSPLKVVEAKGNRGAHRRCPKVRVLGAFRGATGQSGLAEIMMPKGTYARPQANVWKPGYEAPARTVAIDADLTVEIAVAALPEEDPDAAWQM